MSDPCAELRPAILVLLKADPALQALFGADTPVKVYDVPPVNAVKPFLVVSSLSAAPNQAECYDGAEATASLDVWSLTDPPGLAQVEQMGAAAQLALLGLGDLPNHSIVSVIPQLALYTLDADGKSARGVLRLRVFTQPL